MKLSKSSFSSSVPSSQLASPSTPASASMNGFARHRFSFDVLLAKANCPLPVCNHRRRIPSEYDNVVTLVAAAHLHRISLRDSEMAASEPLVHSARSVAA